MNWYRSYFWRGLAVTLAIGLVGGLAWWWWATSRPEYRLRRALEAVERDDLKTADRVALEFEADGRADAEREKANRMLEKVRQAAKPLRAQEPVIPLDPQVFGTPFVRD